MTHTLNRTGLSEAHPGEEIVIVCMVHRAEKAQKMEEMREIARTVLGHEPENVIGKPLGFGAEEIEMMAPMTGIITAVFTNKDDALKVVKEIKAQKPGISVVLSGLFSDIGDICECAGLKEHTHHISLGVYGKTERLPDGKMLEITTQCGHSLVSSHLIDAVLKKIRKAKMTTEEAAMVLAKPCACGIVNTKRVKAMLEGMV
jgi:hypothetical protein